MTSLMSFAHTVPLPVAPERWVDVGHVVLMDGTIATTRRTIARNEASMRITVFDGVAETEVLCLAGRDPSWWCLDRMADGRWLFYDPARPGQVQRVTPDGQEDGSLHVGEDFCAVQCAPDHTVWVGYYDQGIFAPEDEHGNPPVSAGGIVQFDADGRKSWAWNDTPPSGMGVDECYAMTLAGNVLWSSFYSGFPVACVRDHKPRAWRNTIDGARALAIEGEMVVLAGGYAPEADRIAVLRLGHDSAECIGVGTFALPPSTEPLCLQGRDNIVHIIAQQRWTRLSVRAAVEGVQQKMAGQE
ncbi:hypothetical protein LV564_15695 [Komagataeibacter nataicola]|nr:hypothetical protein [Komagataeibacter nataicola]WEQ55495.1 hypothetical protein LV564_15695 [Komagataeibacter nataicola]WNM09646.1 hypothetical protein RI056_06920 [Komagataeibacter nataicola]GBR16461.1 hypothetical protein AA0616_0803 [Komagataeibacter nataicola NRIC 0616]